MEVNYHRPGLGTEAPGTKRIILTGGINLYNYLHRPSVPSAALYHVPFLWQNDFVLNEILLILTQFGGGPGDPGNTVVRFLLPSIFWTTLMFIAWGQWRRERERRDFYLSAAAVVGLSREMFMFVSEYGAYRGYLGYQKFYQIYPPFEHAATMVSIILVAYAFLRYFVKWDRFSLIYLYVALGWTILLWAFVSPLWIGYLNAQLRDSGRAPLFGSFWGDMVFRISAVAIYSIHLGGFLRARVRGMVIPGALLAAFVFFWLDDLLMIVNLAQKEIHIGFFAPVRHNLHIWGVALLLGVYWWDQKRRITEMEETGRQGEESLREYAELLEHAPVLVRNMDDRVILWNSGMEELYGWPRIEAMGKVTHDLLKTEHPIPQAEIRRLLLKEGRWEGELRHFRCDGRPIIVKSLQELHHDVHGRPLAIIEVNSDITERKAAEEELRRAKLELEKQNRELRQLDRMKDGLVRDVSHELKTPVAKQSMQLEILEGILRRHGLEGETSDILDIMEASLKRQGDTIRNLLDISRLEAGGRKYRREPVRLDKVIREVLDDYHFNIQQQSIEVDTKLNELTLESDGEMLRHVISNLVNNAIKFRSTDRPRIGISLTAIGQEALISVSDNGIGLRNQDRVRAFERFYKGTPSMEGSGVGLSISKHITEDLGGTIQIESEGPGKGTAVFLRFPLTSMRSA